MYHLWNKLCTHNTFWNFPGDLQYCVLFISYCFFSLNFGLGNVYWPFFEFTHLSCVTIADELLKGILHFCSRFLLLEVPLDSFIVSIPPLQLHICTFIVSMCFIRIHNILIIVILNSLINPTSVPHLSLVLKIALSPQTLFFSWLLACFVFICWKPDVIFSGNRNWGKLAFNILICVNLAGSWDLFNVCYGHHRLKILLAPLFQSSVLD